VAVAVAPLIAYLPLPQWWAQTVVGVVAVRVVVVVFVEEQRRPFQSCGCFVGSFLLDSRRLILGWLVQWDPHCTGQG
jgi:hypothetical protein